MIQKKTFIFNSEEEIFPRYKIGADARNETYLFRSFDAVPLRGEPDIPYYSTIMIRKTKQVWRCGQFWNGDDSLSDEEKKEIENFLSGYVKKEDLEGYLQEEDLEDYAKLTDIPKPPTVDTTLSNTSTNPVENRAISREMAALRALAQSIIDNGLGDIADFALTFLEESAVENLTADAMSEKMIYIGMEPYEGEEEGSSSSAAYDNGYANVSDAIYDNGYVKVGNATYDNGFVTI